MRNDQPEIEPKPSDQGRDEDKDLTKVSRIVQSTWTVQTVSVLGLFLFATIFALHIAKPLILPVVLAVLLSILLTPITSIIGRWVPRGLASLIVLAFFVVSVGAAIWITAQPAQEWFAELPKKLSDVERQTKNLMQPVEKIKEAAEQVEEMTGNGNRQQKQVAVAEKPALSDSIFSITREFIGQLAVLLGLLYFFLATGDTFLRKLVLIMPNFEDKRKAVAIARGIQEDVARHLLTITAINIGLGAALAAALLALGVENPIFWGVLAAILNFIPYLGALVGIGSLLLSSLMAADGATLAAFLPALVYLVLTTVEGTFLTPLILGRRLKLNPVIVFLGILFWAWLWGVPGALIAVPLLVMLKVICDNVKSLQGLGELMGD